ncbi:hypothetical protein PsyrH_14180 [Pseudomonas syringae pv. syringae HS191]|nr:hypothetical protein PsyrH_14180 [Pseudomonas syringae pv. syringae HS191]
MPGLYIGCAGWSLARENWPDFPDEGSHLQRYASRFNAVEINSSFYRPHSAETYARWAESVPAGFRFSVKMPKLITHELRLRECEAVLATFLSQCTAMDDKLGCLLVQLPPSLDYAPQIADGFFKALRNQYAGRVVLEPRHQSWRQAQALLIEHRIAQVAAIRHKQRWAPARWVAGCSLLAPARCTENLSQRLYRRASGRLGRASVGVCSTGNRDLVHLDNTASGAAVGDALALQALVKCNRAE